MGENKYGESGHLSIFNSLKQVLMMLLKRKIEFNFYTIKDTDSMKGHV